MADPTSIIGLVSASVSLVDRIHHYTSSFKKAPKCVADLGAEVTAVGAVLEMLRKYLERGNAKSRAFERTSALFFAADGCKSRLQEIEDVLSPLVSGNKTSRFLSRLKWPLDEDDTIQEVEALHRYAQLFEFSLTIDGFAILSETQVNALAQIQAKLDSVVVSARAQSNRVQAGLHDVLDAVKNLPNVTSTVEEISEKVQKLLIQANDADIKRKKDAVEADRKLLLDSLPSFPFDEKHRDLQLRRTSGLGQWLLNMPEFKSFCEGNLKESTLWCHGAPGAGKTFLTSIVIDHLESQPPQRHIRMVYFYFDYRQQSEQTPFKFVTCLLKQILSSYSQVPTAAAGLCRRLKDNKSLPGWGELTQILFNICNEADDLFLVLDALDESDENSNREPILGVLDHLIRSPTRLFITSRSYCLDINSTFEGCSRVSVEATESDIRAFVDRRISDSRRMSSIINGTLREEVVQAIVQKSQGMFLLPALQVGDILSQTNEREVRQALQELPSGLTQNLDLAVERIKNQSSQSRSRANLAMRILMWLSHAKRTLTVDELRHGLAITPGITYFDLTNLTESVLLVESCLGLVTVDKETSIIRLVHLSVNEYLQERREKLFPHADGKLAVSCLTYFLMDPVLEKMNEWNSKGYFMEPKNTLSEIPFLDYAVFFWGIHAALCFDPEVERCIRRFLVERSVLSFWGSITNHEVQSITEFSFFSFSNVTGISALHIAARFGIERMARDILDEPNSDPNPQNSFRQTPLMLAATHGHKSLVDILLSRNNIELNSINDKAKTALTLAIENSHNEIVRKLLSHPEVDVNLGCPLIYAQDDYTRGDSPSNLKIKNKIAKLLLSRGDINVNVIEEQGFSAWEQAARHADVETLELLLSQERFDPSVRISPNHSCLKSCLEDLCTALHNTDVENDEGLVNFARISQILEQDDRFPMPDFGMLRVSWPIIYYAFSNIGLPYEDGVYEIDGFPIWGHSSAYRDKLRKRLELVHWKLFCEDSLGRTYFHYAATESKENEVRFLLGQGLDPAAADKEGWTVLHHAVDSGSDAAQRIVQALLDSGADVSATDHDGRTALHIAAGSNSNAAFCIVQTLLDHGAESDVVGADGITPLHQAAELGKLDVLEILLKRGASPNAWALKGTPLTLAAQAMNEETIRSLIQNGGDLNILDCYGRSGGDWISIFPRLAEALGSLMTQYTPSPAKEARTLLLECLRERIDIMLTLKEGDGGKYAHRLGRQLLFLNDEIASKIAFGIDLWYTERKPGTPLWNEPCSNCNSNVAGNRFVCRSCPRGIVCSKCVNEPEREKLPWCQGHEFFEIPCDGWENLPKKALNEEGQDFVGWLKDLEKKYAPSSYDIFSTDLLPRNT